MGRGGGKNKVKIEEMTAYLNSAFKFRALTRSP